MRFSIPLKARFMLAMCALVIVVLGGFIYAVSEFLDVVERDMIQGELSRDVDRIVALYKRDPGLMQVREPGLKVLVRPRGQTQGLPDAIKGLRPGDSREVRIPEAHYEYGATRRDVGGVSLYVLLDLTRVEKLEKELIGVAWVAGLSALFLAIILALWLSRLVTRPVEALAGRLSRIVPGQQRPVLRVQTGDRQLDAIVKAFDAVLDRFDAFVAREQTFTEDASHELRTPLAVTISSIDLLATDATLSDKSRARLARARVATNRMRELIESLLFFAREETSDDYATAVSPVLREAIAMQADLRAGEQSQQPAVALEVHREHQVRAPASMLLSLVDNLLRNAIEHAGDSTIDMVLDGPCLSIQDRGVGIAPAELPRLFDHRFRGPHSNGQGLGLFLVKRICERFDWQINVSSTIGVGTRFDVRFLD